MGKIYNALEKSGKNRQDNPDVQMVPKTQKELRSIPKTGNTQKNDGIDVPGVDEDKLVTLSRPHGVLSEQFRLLKNNILFPESGHPPRTIMVTSASPGEGKSFISANLAVTMAKSIDEFVLLIDCDLRKPSIHSLFGYDSKNIRGLSNYLSNGLLLSDALKKTAINKLTILPAGQTPNNPSELLSSEQMRRMLHEVKLRYNDRYILIDTPPYITSETNAIARHVDGIVIVIRQGKTRIKEVQDIVDIYGKDKIIGVVKNFAAKSVGYGYGYHKNGYGYHKNGN